MSFKIALAGNPNSGKTTLFNALTGSNQFVGNWPGVTVEKKEGKLKNHKNVILTDLPGIYSLSPYTLEEVVARNYLINERPDAIINIVDGTNLERNLYLTTQLIELGIPVIMAINVMDVVEKRGDKIDFNKLSKELGCEVISISALKGTGIKDLANRAAEIAKCGGKQIKVHKFSTDIEDALERIEQQLPSNFPVEQRRFYAIKLFERDEKLTDELASAKSYAESVAQEIEKSHDDDSESIIANERYNFITSIIGDCYSKKDKVKRTMSDKIDRIVTNRWLALPIFAVVMVIVYYVSVTTVGSLATDWVNDGVFGDGWHLFGIGSGEYSENSENYELEQSKIEAFVAAAQENGIDTEKAELALSFNYESYENEAEAQIAQAEAEKDLSEFVSDAEVANVTGTVEIEDENGNIIETLQVSADDFNTALTAEEPDPADYGVWVPGVPALIGDLLEKINTADWLNSLILDGIVAGVGAVLGFVPQMLVLFLFLAFLEGCGYMARIAFIMDRIFRKFGLSGKSFIPMLIGTGCGIPGIMASRTIENDRDRKMTIITTTFIPCSAKLPIIALIAGAIFNGAWWVSPSAYFVGVAAIVVSGIILKKTKLFKGDPAPFVMELPEYHMPTVVNILRGMWERGWSFIKKAGTVILLSTIFIWFTSNFGIVDGKFTMVSDLSDGFLAAIGKFIAPIFAPLGWGDWTSAVAAIMGLVAKENVVSTFGILYGFGEVSENGVEIWAQLASSFSALAAYSMLVFNLLCAPCFAAVGAIKREMNNFKWTLFAIGYQTLFAYAVSLCIYQLGLLFTGGIFTAWTAVSIVVFAVFCILLFRSGKETRTLRKAVIN